MLFLGGTPQWISGRTMRDAVEANAGEFKWATVVEAKLPATPTPPMEPPAAPPAPQIVPTEIMAAMERAVPEPTLRLDAPDTALKVMKRRWKDADIYLLFNESDRVSEHTVGLANAGHSVEAWDAQTGEIKPIASTRVGGRLTIKMRLEPYTTRVLVVR